MIKLLVDGDVLAYRHLAAATKTEYVVYNEHNEPLASFLAGRVDGKTGPQRAKDFRGKNQHWIIAKESEEPPIGFVTHSIHETLTHLVEEYKPDEVKIILSDEGPCWRSKIYPDYKTGRPPRPRLLPEVRAALMELGAYFVDDFEADDIISIEAAKDPQAVIVSVDKDFLQISGTHYNPFERKEVAIDPISAEFNLWTQVLVGDKVDNIPGCPGIGKVKAAKILDNADIEDFPLVCLQAYEQKEQTVDDMLLQYRLVKLVSSEEEACETFYPEWYMVECGLA